MRKRILKVGLILLVGLVGGVAVNGYSPRIAEVMVALAIGYALGVAVILLEEVKP